jgi:hypothetical protein
VLAYNIIDINNEDEVKAYKDLRKIKKGPLTVKEIDCCRRKNDAPTINALFKRKTTEK